jgi:predicted HTH transcriptional regulator
MLVHRDYSVREFAEVQVFAGESLYFHNPGGVPEAVYRRLIFDDQGTFRPVRSVTEIRNPCLADIFYGLGPMDKAGTGLADVDDLATENGGAANFGVGTDNRRFGVLLRQPVQTQPLGSRLAFPISPVGLYTTNLLPFRVFPDHLSIFRVCRPIFAARDP